MPTGKPAWVYKATRKLKLRKRVGRFLLVALHELLKAEEPITAGYLAKKYDEDRAKAILALSLLQEMGLVRSKRTTAKNHPYAALELEYELLDMDKVIQNWEKSC